MGWVGGMGNEFLVLLIPLAACLAIFWIALKVSSSRISGQYQKLAKHFGLEMEQAPVKMGGFVRPDPALFGKYREREVSFSAPGKGLKGSRQTESLLKVELRNRKLKAQIAPKGLFGGLGQKASSGQGRWTSGDEVFDRAVDVRSKNEDLLEKLMTDERRSRMAELLREARATLYIGDGILAFAKLGLIGDESSRVHMEKAVEFLCDFAEAVEG